MIDKNSNKHKSVIFALLWFLINLFFSAFTNLADDEAYYWLFAKFLDWGYFDHPPMIAAMIKAGGFLLNNELGVRFFTTVFSGLTLYLLFYLTEYKKPEILFLLYLTTPAFHAFGFISAPDVPLLFFAALYLLFFKKYLANDTIINAFWLAFSSAMMMYSKYHGILLITFTILLNFSLIKRKSFWLTLFIALLLFTPHIAWQIKNNYPSVQYHLVDRVNRDYQVRFTTDYLLGQFGMCGPLLFLSFFILLRKPVHNYIRTLKNTTLLIFAFFFIFSFRTAIEANWGAIAYLPLLLFVHSCIDTPLIKFIKISSFILFVLLIAIRISLMFPNETLRFSVVKQFYRDKDFFPFVKEVAGNLPVAFLNTYQKPSKYSFYYQKPSISLNSHWYRRNQFDKWIWQKQMQGQDVMLVSTDAIAGAKYKKLKDTDLYYLHISNFKSYGYVHFDCPTKKFNLNKGDVIRDSISIKNIWKDQIVYDTTTLKIMLVAKNNTGDFIFDVAEIKEYELNSEKKIPFTIPINLEKGEYKATFGIYTKHSFQLWNSSVYKIEMN